MQKIRLAEITIKLPEFIANNISMSDIISSMIYKALVKSEYYLGKCRIMEEKYGLNFSEFQKKSENQERENFEEWDDLILWEGYETAYHEWLRKHKELKKCIQLYRR